MSFYVAEYDGHYFWPGAVTMVQLNMFWVATRRVGMMVGWSVQEHDEFSKRTIYYHTARCGFDVTAAVSQ